MTYFCYVDESGTPEVPGTSSHFVLVGLAIPIERWGDADREIAAILAKYDLADAEVHTAWLARRLVEQDKIPNFASLDWASRRSAAARYRAGELLRLRRLPSPKAYRQAKKNYAHTNAYTHLLLAERLALLDEIAAAVSGWDYAFLFAEAIDKLHFDEAKVKKSIGDQAFEQLVSRFQQFLKMDCPEQTFGVLVHDNNQTVAKKHTDQMRQFHKDGTLWAKIDRLAETPLFVDSKLTQMVQIADLLSYALRRYVENGEENLLNPVIARAHNFKGRAVGVRHYSKLDCACKICVAHGTRRRNRRLLANKNGEQVEAQATHR